MIVGAIDPGKTGGYAVFKDWEGWMLYRAGRVNFDDPEALQRIFWDTDDLLIERAQASSQMGSSSAFEYGRSFGRIEAAIMTIPEKRRPRIHYCAPAWWKGMLAVPTDKAKATKMALNTIKGLDKFVKLKSDHGVAEAALMCLILMDPKLFTKLEVNNEKRTKPKTKRPSYRL
jgi:hypothetical protein